VPATVGDSSALVLPTTAKIAFFPVANYAGTPGGLSVRLADSAQTLSTSTDLSGVLGGTNTWSAAGTMTLGRQEHTATLLSGGKVLIAHFDWLPLPGNVVDQTERLIQTYNPKWYERFGNKNGSYPDWFRDLREARFEDVTSFSFDIHVPYTAEAWRGRIRASAGVGGSLSADEIVRFDSQLKSLLEGLKQRQVKEEARDDFVLYVPHCVFAVYGHKPKVKS